jgi:uncharacterized protein
MKTGVPVFISVEELQLHRILLSEAYAPDVLDYHGADFRQRGELTFKGSAELVGSEIRVRGHLATRLEAPCDRCLGAVEIPIERDVDLFYRPMQEIAREEEVEISPDELDVSFYEGDGIALADVVTEQVILAVPMKVICHADCKGLCPVCGANRNLEACACQEPRRESPFSSLLER